MTIRKKAFLALLSSVFFWSSLVVVARATVGTVSPMALLSLRLVVASIAFLPFFLKSKVWKNKQFNRLVGVSLLSTVNLVFFMWGIQFTTASTSQLIYAAMPILVIMIGYIHLKENIDLHKIIGVLVGLIGIIFIVYTSAVTNNQTIVGSLKGNMLIIIAMSGWLAYILHSKSLSRYFSPVEIGSTSILVSFPIAIILTFWELSTGRFTFPVTLQILTAGTYMGIFGTFLTYLLYQYAIKHLTSLTATLSSYIQPITTAILEIIFLGARLTIPFIIGSVFVFSGIFFATTFELYHRRKKSQLLSG